MRRLGPRAVAAAAAAAAAAATGGRPRPIASLGVVDDAAAPVARPDASATRDLVPVGRLPQTLEDGASSLKGRLARTVPTGAGAGAKDGAAVAIVAAAVVRRGAAPLEAAREAEGLFVRVHRVATRSTWR